MHTDNKTPLVLHWRWTREMREKRNTFILLLMNLILLENEKDNATLQVL